MLYLGSAMVVFALFGPSYLRQKLHAGTKPIAKIDITAIWKQIYNKLHPSKHSLIPIITEIVTRLNAGESLEDACKKTIGPVVEKSHRSPGHNPNRMSESGVAIEGNSDVLTAQSSSEYSGPLKMFYLLKEHLDAESKDVFESVIAALRFAEYSGCPLVQVLDNIVDSILEAAEAARKRRIAMAAPRTSARILAVLPLGAVGIASLFGVDPIHIFFHTLFGFLAFSAGMIFMAMGFIWSSRLVKNAERKSE